MEGLTEDLLLIFGLILLNGFFTGSEIAVLSLKKVYLNQLSEKGDKRADLLLNLKTKPERFFATIQIGVTLLSTLASVYGGTRLMPYLSPYLKQIEEGIFSDYTVYVEETALFLLVITISYFSLVFGELIPKSLALRHAAIFARITIYPLHFFSRLFGGFTFVLTFSSNLVLRLFKDQTSFSESRLHEEEIRQILKEGVQEGSIEHTEEELISNVFEIGDTSAREIMTPRVHITAISMEAPPEEIEEIMIHGKHSRIPVYKESLDKIEGFLYVKDYMASSVQGTSRDIEKLLRPVFHVPGSMKLDKILKELQRTHNYMAIVVDEYGGTSGIVTVEDILEEIVGEIKDSSEDADEKLIIQLPSGGYLIAGECSINEFNEYFLNHPLPESEGYNSVAGFTIETMGRFPEVGEKILWKQQSGKFELQFELLRKVRQKLVQFRLRTTTLILQGKGEEAPDREESL